MRLLFDDLSRTLSVADIRLCDGSFRPDPAKLNDAQRKIERGEALLLGVGLSRPFQHPNDAPPLHWLQVNNLHFESDPVWRLPVGQSGWRTDDDSLF